MTLLAISFAGCTAMSPWNISPWADTPKKAIAGGAIMGAALGSLGLQALYPQLGCIPFKIVASSILISEALAYSAWWGHNTYKTLQSKKTTVEEYIQKDYSTQTTANQKSQIKPKLASIDYIKRGTSSKEFELFEKCATSRYYWQIGRGIAQTVIPPIVAAGIAWYTFKK